MERNQDADRLSQRTEALNQLRGNRGSLRQLGSEGAEDDLKEARSVLKEYARQEKLKQSSAANPIALDSNSLLEDEDEDEDDVLPETPIADTLDQLRHQMQAKRALKKRLEAQDDLDVAENFSPALQHHLISQLLTSDFLEHTRLWLGSSSDPRKELPSTSLEELETCQKQVKYRLKVLQVLLKDTQQELDYLTLQTQMMKGFSNSTDE